MPTLDCLDKAGAFDAAARVTWRLLQPVSTHVGGDVCNREQPFRFAFWLPTATDYFYPDFVAELEDGRVLVAEYKGDAYATNDDSREKRLVGERWAQETGECFVMVEKRRDGQDMAAQLLTAMQRPRPDSGQLS